MAFIGNLLWFTFGGFISGTLWMLAGLFMCCTVVGVPVGIACFRIGRFAYCPYGKQLVPAEWMGEKRIFGTGFIQVLWILFLGWEIALTQVVIGLVLCCTVVGIPWAIAYFHLAQASFAPLGKRVVDKAYAKVLQQKFYEKKANEALGMGSGGVSVIVNNNIGSTMVAPGGAEPPASSVPPVSDSLNMGLGKSWIWVLLAVLFVVPGCVGLLLLAGSGRGEGNAPEADLSVLTLRPETTYSTAFGGRASPEAYSFSSSSCIPAYANCAGNPIYFMQPLNVTWSCYKASPGGQHIFKRNDEYIVGSPIRDDAWSVLPVSLADIIGHGQARGERLYSGFDVQSTTDYVSAMRTNALHLGSVFPAPVVMADNAVDDRFCYLNDFGKPSVLMWATPTNCRFECIEGQEALAGYAKGLRELRQVVAESQNEGLRACTKAIDLNVLPDIFIGDLDAGTRERASVSYEFCVKDFQYTISEIAECNQWKHVRCWTPEMLDEELAFFSRFETEASTEKAFEPLYCYLTQRKILIEEENGKNRSGESGKKTQHLTFDPIGKQTTTSRVELSATTESGGKVTFSVDNHLGKIEGHTLSFTGTGTVCVTALQWGNDTWRFAKAVECVEVVKTPQTVDFAPIGPQEQTAQVTLSATSDSGNEVSFRVTSGPGKIENGVLTFHGSGPVEVMATAREDDIWETASATQTVEVKDSEETGNHRRTPGGATATGIAPLDGRMIQEFVPLAEALEMARDNPTGANYKKLEAVWSALSGEKKAATKKPVLWAYCAMLASKGHLGVAAKRQGEIDYQAFLNAVSERCHACRGAGRIQERCRTCGGTGVKRVTCGTCHGSGNCAFCHGSGRTGGVLGGRPLTCPKCGGSGQCRSCSGGTVKLACADCHGGSTGSGCRECNGAGRIVSTDKCEYVVESNIKEALRICHGNHSGASGSRDRETVAKNIGKGAQAVETKTIMLPGGAMMEMVWCPPGSFLMGSPEDEEDRSDGETQHRVTLTKGFWMAKTEVTQAQWKSVMGNNPSNNEGDNLPVENVGWFDCQEFCRKAGLALPTEAEWEYACRAGTTGRYAGTGKLDDMGWWGFSGNSEGETHAVGQKRPNAWGLYDMHGNVWEWCADWQGDYPSVAVTDPTGAGSGDLRIIRGGSYISYASDCRSAFSDGDFPDLRRDDNGFRPVARQD